MTERGELGPYQEVPEKVIEMIDVTRVSTVFESQNVLAAIADKLLQRGLISGYEISPATSGYIHNGQITTATTQFRLEILCDDQKHIEAIKSLISTEIGKKWDVPKITVDQLRVNKELVGFIKNAENEHKRFLTQKRWTRSMALTAFVSIGSIVGAFAREYLEDQKDAAIAAERAESYKKIVNLERTIQDKVLDIEQKLRDNVPLTVVEPMEFGAKSFEETREILQITRDAEHEMRKLLESQLEH